MEAKVDRLHLFAQHKKNSDLPQKQKKQKTQNSKKNLTVWKSNNQGYKEATFIQRGRKGGVAETGREA